MSDSFELMNIKMWVSEMAVIKKFMENGWSQNQMMELIKKLSVSSYAELFFELKQENFINDDGSVTDFAKENGFVNGIEIEFMEDDKND